MVFVVCVRGGGLQFFVQWSWLTICICYLNGYNFYVCSSSGVGGCIGVC